ncbi:MAG: ABC transporter ATP-binding protein [Thermoleophilia bacterium]|nr:ABC transporter ATP-binding protein [Thermoleophilia bacterium]
MSASESDPVIVVDALRKTYGATTAVDGVTFAVQAGEVFGLLGSNGAGKTTTVECLEGLRRPDAGEVRVLGVDPLAHPERLRGRVGCQLQESHLPDRMRVWEALDLFAAASPRPVDWTEVLEAWGLAPKRDAAFASLSGGQRQRLLVALALVTDPEVVFLDEMTTGLDPAARHVTWGLIEAIRERGTTVVLVTHFMDEAERLCDRVAVMDAGRIVATGTPEALIEATAGAVRVKFTGAPAGAAAASVDVAGPAAGCGGAAAGAAEAAAGEEPGECGWLLGVPHVHAVERRGGTVTVTGDGPVLAHVARALLERGLEPPDLRVERPTLEETFLRLTGHGLE